MRIPHAVKLTLALIILVACPACSGRVALTSEMQYDDGVIYHLPKTVLTLTVRQYKDVDAGNVFYTLGGPGAASGTAASPTIIDEQSIISETIPDPDFRYVLRYHASAFSDDRLCISRQPDGLLHDVQFAADDRTPQIIFNIARFLGGFLGKPVAFRQGELAGAKVLVRSYTARIDPFDAADVESYNSTLERMFGEKLRLDFSRMADMIKASSSTWPDGCSLKSGSLKDDCPRQRWADRCDADNICYRTKLKLPVYLNHGTESVDVKYAEVINAWDIGTISVTRALLVQKITKLRFEDGALVAALVRKPSEVEEASLVPLNVMNAILTVPSGLWSGVFADTASNTALLTQMSRNEGVIATMNANRNNLLLTGDPGTPGTPKDSYQLNCREPVAKSGNLNLLN